jgi:FkbM family methyltransferase
VSGGVPTATRLRRELGRLKNDSPTEARALTRRAFWRLAARFTPVIAVDRAELRFFVSTQDEVLGRRLFVYDTMPERDIELAFAALAEVPGLELRDYSVVEIGANIGSHTVELLTGFGASDVIAIEPGPANCDLLRQNVLANDVSDRVKLLELALSDHDGSVSLELSATNSGDHRVRVGDGAAPNRSTVEVRAARFDSLVQSGEIELDKIGLVWMDAQGHEGHILSAATTLLGSATPIVMEYWPHGLRGSGGLDLLHRLIAEHYSHVIDIAPPGGTGPRVLRADMLSGLESEYGWDRSDERDLGTDLVLCSAITGP